LGGYVQYDSHIATAAASAGESNVPVEARAKTVQHVANYSIAQ